jgi:hypothetical protein
MVGAGRSIEKSHKNEMIDPEQREPCKTIHFEPDAGENPKEVRAARLA